MVKHININITIKSICDAGELSLSGYSDDPYGAFPSPAQLRVFSACCVIPTTTINCLVIKRMNILMFD